MILIIGWTAVESSATLAVRLEMPFVVYSIAREEAPPGAMAAARARLAALAPGLALCLAVTLAAMALEAAERRLFGGAWVESLVLAILVGAVVRTLWTPGEAWRSGISFSAKTLLETAVVLLGASVSATTLMSIGWGMLAGIAGLVLAAISLSFLIGRAFGLAPRMAILVACGNSICGNSAIAAVAPVIGAKGEEVAASIAFTALLGVVMVVGLPLAGRGLGMNPIAYGELSGLTVYAVPQVLAAAAPLGAAAVQAGTLVKLTRVLMLGPVCFGLSVLMRRRAGPAPAPAGIGRIGAFAPWFILGFLGLAALRSCGAIPPLLAGPAAVGSSLLTLVSMAALGLCTDLKSVARAGTRVASVVTLSLAVLILVSLVLIGVQPPHAA